MTVMKQQLEFHYFIDIIVIDINFTIKIFVGPILHEY